MPKSSVQKCRLCGCTDLDCLQCVERTGKPCHWVASDLCSACSALQVERIELIDLLADVKMALEFAPKEIAVFEPHYQLLQQAFQHETLGRCLRFRAEHELL